MTRVRLALVALACLLLAAPFALGLAQQPQPPKALVITAQNLMADDARHRALAEKGGDPNALFPGDVVHYRLVFTNVTTVPVRNIELKDPLPGGLRYVGGSAGSDREDVAIDYSIDGGATYAAQPMIEEVVAGERVQKPAPPERYTHVRWRVRGWVEPGAQVSAEFRATMPERRKPDTSEEAPTPASTRGTH